jgi:hypothetical protein
MNPRDFCKVARRLASGTDPADLRTAAICIYSDLQAAGGELGTLHSLRIDADYEMRSGRVEDQKTVTALIRIAEDLIKSIDSAFAGTNSKAIMKSMQDFWIDIERGQLRGRPRIV